MIQSLNMFMDVSRACGYLSVTMQILESSFFRFGPP
jgi:hypothetical protein